MPNLWTSQSTLGDTKPIAQEKTQTSSTHLETKNSTKLSLHKQSNSVLVTMEKTTVQFEKNAYGMRYLETNRTEYGEVFLTENEMPLFESGVNDLKRK